MRKITYLLSLFLMMMGTAMAQTYATPGTEKVLTSENLRALTTETPIILCPVQKDMYKQWYDGNSTTTYGTSGTLVTESNVFLWVPILSDGVATGTGYLKKRTAESDDVAYLQASNITTFGAQGTAQVFYPVTPVHGASGNSTAFDHSNIVSGYNEANLVRLVRGSSEGTTWFNFNGKQYNSGTGIWTAMEVRNAADMQTIIPPVTDLANLSNNKAYTLRTRRSDLVANNDGSRIATTNDISGTFDKNNTRYQFALLKNTSGSVYLYSISASKFVNKTGDLVNSPAEPILFKNGNAAGTFVLYFDASHYVNIGGDNQLAINGWNTADEGNSYTITPVAEFSPSEELLNSINTVDVIVNFIVGEKTYSSANKSFLINTAINAETFTTDLNGTYLTYASTDVETVTAETSTINVTCTAQPLPFIISENFENAKWYMVNMHSNESNYMWTATMTDGTPTLTVKDKGSVYKETIAPDDTRLWCFVGDICGFKIYNKAVGSAYTMNKTSDGDNAVSWGEAGSGTLYQLQKTASNAITNGFCFLPIGHSHYLNHRQPNIQGWTSRDEGSTCKIFTPDAFLLNYAADMPAGPANSLGTAQYFNTEGKFDNFNNVIDAANADHFNATATANLAALLTEYAADEANATTNEATITAGYYRLMNYKYKNYMTSGLNGSDNSLWGGLSAAEAPGTAGTIVKVVADESNYKLYVQGLEVGQMTDASARLNLTGGGVFTIANTGNKYTFMDVSLCEEEPSYPNHRAIHQASDNRIVGWETGADATKWYVIPATTLDLPLNVVGDKTYATTYLPFGVTLPDDGSVKAYIVTLAESEKATVSEVADIPANQGVVLVSETAAAKATLTLGTASANCTGNKLNGTNPRLTIAESAKNDYYIFGNGSNGVGFYHPNSITLKENRAYLPASAVTVSGSGVNGFKLDFGGVNTGIEAVIQADEANATYYDLSGRRVIRPAKGIYVKNGRKVYVK